MFRGDNATLIKSHPHLGLGQTPIYIPEHTVEPGSKSKKRSGTFPFPFGPSSRASTLAKEQGSRDPSQGSTKRHFDFTLYLFHTIPVFFAEVSEMTADDRITQNRRADPLLGLW